MGLSHIIYKVRRRLFGDPAPVVPVIPLSGPIDPSRRFGRGVSMSSTAPLIDRAFHMPGISAVALLINSPGGAVVQSAHVADRIRALAREKDVPVLAFAEDVAASGGYMLALAGDEIYAHEASLIGSIGVVAGGFGFVDLMKRFGVERRLYTAGEHKASLDPFREENKDEVERFGHQLESVHDIFKAYVRERRGKRLKGGAVRSRIFSGDVFLGEEARKMGLIDGIGDVRSILRDRFGDHVRMPVIEARKSFFSGLRSPLSGPGAGQMTPDPGEVGAQIFAAAEERMMWSRFGL